MIPKIIHYCWFGNKKKPRKVQKNINSWKKLCPDYEIMEWNETNFPINDACSFVKGAYQAGKFAFVADVVRLVALQKYGGIYLDTDVQLLKSFDLHLNERFFISHESKESFCTAVMGAESGSVLIHGFLETYQKDFDVEKIREYINSIQIKNFCERQLLTNLEYDKEYVFPDIHIFQQTVFCAKNIYTYKLNVTKDTVSIHHLDASWFSGFQKFKKMIKKIFVFLHLGWLWKK